MLREKRNKKERQMKALQDLIGKQVIYSMFTPNGIHNSATFEGVLKEIDRHPIAVKETAGHM